MTSVVKSVDSGRRSGRSTSNLPWLRRYNEARVLSLVRSEGQVTRRGLADRTGLEFQTISNIVARLTAAGLLVEAGSMREDSGRREATAFQLDATMGYSVGIEINRSRTCVVVADFAGQVHAVKTGARDNADPHATLATLTETVHSCIEDSRIPSDRLIGYGVAVPGPINRLTSEILAPINFPGWEGFRIGEELARALDSQIFMEDLATAAGLGEWWQGAARGTDDYVYLYLGDGVGAGLVSGGRLVHGHWGNAGEIGHLEVDPNGPECQCGAQGCLVQWVSLPGVLRVARRHAADYHALRNKELTDASAEAVLRALRSGSEPWVASAVAAIGKRLALAVSALRAVTDPAFVVLGGPVARMLGPELMRHVLDYLSTHTLPGQPPLPELRLATAGDDEVAFGAALLPFHEITSS